jgi:NADH:ubiquinone oxidoreductase subunit 3 (subunit A)
MDLSIILTPPLAFILYIPLVLILVGIGKVLAGPEHPNDVKSSVYGSGEEAANYSAAPGYQPFFLIAFFFAVLHLGMLVLGSGGLTLTTGIYLAGVIFALIALMLG